MWKILRLMTLLAGAAAILTSDEGISTCYSGLSFMVIGIAILLGVSFAMFTGWASIMSKRKAPYLIRPSLSTSPFNKMVALQFQHFASYFFILLGTAGVIRNWSVTNFWGLLEIPAFGLGLLFGTIMLLRVFRGRFKNPQTEQVGGGNAHELPSHPSFAPTKARATP